MIRRHRTLPRMVGNRIGSRGLAAFAGACRQQAPFFDDFGPFPACPRACARGALVARTGRLVGGHLGRFPQYRACCRSSVVEHSIGNGEVDSSILSGSTIHPIEIRDGGKEDPTAVGMRSARINIDIDWNRSNCRTHRSSCCKGRHRLRHQPPPLLPPPHRIRILDNTPGLPRSKSRGEDGKQALVRHQQWFHLLAQESGLTGQPPRN